MENSPELKALIRKNKCLFRYNDTKRIAFMPGHEVSEEEVKAFLTEAALAGF